MAHTIPNCKSYDPTYGFELAVIIQDGLKRMYEQQENCFYYITTMNENYAHPDMPQGAEEGIIKGIYLLKGGKKTKATEPRVQLMGAGSILREVEAAADILRNDYGVESDIWSVTSVNELARDGQRCQRENLLKPDAEASVPYLTQVLADKKGPAVLATDYIKSYGEQLRAFIPQNCGGAAGFKVLGTDGFGRSDTRKKLRHFFEVSREFIVLAALSSLAEEGKHFTKDDLLKARKALGIAADKNDPTLC